MSLERKDDKWRYVVDIGRDPLPPFKRHRKATRWYATRQQALDEGAVIRADNTDRTPSTAHSTVGSLLEAWWEVAKPDLAPQTWRGYRRALDLYLIPAFGSTPLNKFKTQQIDDLYARLRKVGGVGGKFKAPKPLSVSTIRKIHAVLNAACQQGVAWKHLRANPCDNVRLPSQKKAGRTARKRRQINLPLVMRVLAECDIDLLDAAFLAMATGGRAGELCAIRWTDIDWHSGNVILEDSIGVVDGELVVLGDEERKSETRTVAVGDRILALLKARLERQEIVADEFEQVFDEAGYVLSDAPWTLQPLSPADLSARWRNAAARASDVRYKSTGKKLPLPVRFHDLRAVAVSAWLDSNVPTPVIVQSAGWTSDQMMRFYGRTFSVTDRRPADAMETMFRQLEPGDEDGS